MKSLLGMLGKESLHEKKAFSKSKNHSTASKVIVLERESLKDQTSSFLQWIT